MDGEITQAIQAAVQRHPNTDQVDDRYSSDIVIAYRMLLHGQRIGVGTRFLGRQLDSDMVGIGSVQTEDLYQDPLSGGEVLHCIIHPLVAQLLQANKVFHTEQLHEGTGPNDTDDPRLSNTAFIDQVVAFSVLAVVELSAADRHCLMTACDHDTALRIDALYDILDLGTQALGDQVFQDIIGLHASEILGAIHAEACRDHDLKLAFENDRSGLPVSAALNALDHALKDALAAQGFHQIKQIILGRRSHRWW